MSRDYENYSLTCILVHLYGIIPSAPGGTWQEFLFFDEGIMRRILSSDCTYSLMRLRGVFSLSVRIMRGFPEEE